MTTPRKKKLLILGGKPIASCDIVSHAREAGVYTIVTDFLAPEHSPAKQLADEHWAISTGDIETLSKEINKHDINAIFTGVHEFNINQNLTLCELSNLPFYATRKQMEVMSSKDIYKKMFADFGMPFLPQYYVGKPADIDIKDIEFPVIVKPVDGSGGFGVKICKDEHELSSIMADSAEHSGTSEIMVEKLCNAPEVTIFYIIREGEILLSAMADRETLKFKSTVIPLPVDYTFPSTHLEEYIENFNQKVIDSFKSINLQNGMVFLQAFWDNGQCYIYDIGFRLTGTQEYNILEKICSYNPLKMLVDYALTGKMGSDENVMKLVDPHFGGRYAANMTFLAKPGTINNFEGVDEIQRLKGVEKVVLNHQPGDTIPPEAEGTLVQVAVRIFLISNSKEELMKTKAEVSDLLKVYNDRGKNMIINK